MSTDPLSRRNFMVRAIIGMGAAIGAAIAVPLAGFGILPVVKKREPGWSDAGTAADLAIEEPQERRFLETVRTGWQESKIERTVWIVKRADGSVTAFSPSCPHLGCGYRWFPAEKRFKCPCHASVFDINGTVTAGPAPRALDLLDTRVENGKVLVKFETFQMGVSTRTVA